MIQAIRPELLAISDVQWVALLPYLLFAAGAILTVIFSAMSGAVARTVAILLTVATLIVCAALSASRFGGEGVALFNQMMMVDSLSLFMNVLFCSVAFFSVISSAQYLERERLHYSEFYALTLFAVAGMMMLVSALDLLTLFIALELMSLPVYILVGFRRSDRRSNEAAMKYFILGGAASAILLYGVALLYGSAHSMNINEILAFVQAGKSEGNLVFALGFLFVLVGMLFKVAAAPFHMWMPDVYEGAPVPVTGFMTTGLKAAAFAVFLRVFVSLGYGHGLAEKLQAHIHDILWVIAVATMVIGNVTALVQVNLKRMLAYSSIAHTGYLLVGFLAGSKAEFGYAPILVYLIGYSMMNLGAFVVLTLLAGPQDDGLNLHNLSGLGQKRPAAALAMAIFMFSMAGVPPTAGFAAKYLLFYSAVQSGEIWLTVISVLCSAVSVYYYLRVLVYMYMREPAEGEIVTVVPAWANVAVAAMVIFTLQVGLFPGRLVELARLAVSSL